MSINSITAGNNQIQQSQAAQTRKPEPQNDHDADDGVQAAKAQTTNKPAINTSGRLDTEA